MKKLITILLMLTTAILAQGRAIRSWTYQELFDKADLVVIAKPVSTVDTTEQSTLPHISPDVHFIGLSSDFDVSVVMKGDKNLKKLVLHHYRLVPLPKEIEIVNGPTLAHFDPKAETRFLLFLHRESDGRYSPVSGQTDPVLFSILKIDGMAQ